MRNLENNEMNIVAGGCPDSMVDGSSLANVGCLTQQQFDLLESQLYSADQEPPLVAWTGSLGNYTTFGGNTNTQIAWGFRNRPF